MERVATLLEKLQDQFKKGDPPQKLLLTVQMLQHELLHLQQHTPANDKAMVSVMMPVNVNPPAMEAAAPEQPVALPAKEEKPAEEEKIVQVLQVDEAEIEAELEEIKRNAAVIQQITTNSKPQLLFEPHDDDIPTLPPKPSAEKKEVNDYVAEEKPSVNEKLRTAATEVSHKLTDTPVKDLKKAIGVNDRFLFINELFRGDEAMYERSIKTINGFSIYPEAEYWIRRELKTKLGWKDSDAAVMEFDQLIKRRFA